LGIFCFLLKEGWREKKKGFRMTHPQTTIVLNGKTITIETGRFGAQASGSVTARCGDTVVIATVVATNRVKEGIDYFPLSIEYQEKFYAGGVISSSRFIKREGRPSEGEILVGRVIDRSLRPLFDQASRNEVQLMASPLSIDGVEEPEILVLLLLLQLFPFQTIHGQAL